MFFCCGSSGSLTHSPLLRKRRHNKKTATAKKKKTRVPDLDGRGIVLSAAHNFDKKTWALVLTMIFWFMRFVSEYWFSNSASLVRSLFCGELTRDKWHTQFKHLFPFFDLLYGCRWPWPRHTVQFSGEIREGTGKKLRRLEGPARLRACFFHRCGSIFFHRCGSSNLGGHAHPCHCWHFCHATIR